MKSSALVLCSCIAVLSMLLSGCASLQQNRTREITVRGVAEVVVPPDYVTIGARVVTLDMDIEKAQAENDEKVRAVLSLVDGLGIAPKDVRTAYVSLRPKERRQENKPPVFEGYEASKSIKVVLRDMTKYEQLLSGMLKLGVNRITGISFGSSKEIEKRREARILAIKAAREKAEYLAAELGQEVGKPLWIAEFRRERVPWDAPWSNVKSYYAPDREAKADTEVGTIAPGSITIRSQVEASFALVD